MTYNETTAAMDAVPCACEYNDAYACIDHRYPGERRACEALGIEVEPCPCQCHAIWEAFTEDEDDI